jgi:glycosyltransferase involved in cell wall biosynthesis
VKKIIFVVNNPDFLISHRFDICIEAINQGYQAHVASPFKEDAVSKIEAAGMHYHEINFSRKGKNPFLELKTIVSLISLFRKINPDLVHLITIKPYLYGGIAARISGVKSVVSAVAGLGILFSSNQLKYRLLRLALYPLFGFAFGHKNQSVIFQNADDRNALVNWGVVAKDQVKMIRGSGVDLATCAMFDEPSGVPIVSFAARLLRDKGVEVFVEASRLLKQRNIEARFWLIGEPDLGNANSVTQEQLRAWKSEGLVELFGFRKDIPELFAQSNIVTLPSFYGEGLPKVLIEAAACGRAVITTDHPGCRDAVERDLTALLVTVRDSVALADAIQALIESPDKRKAMGQAGRKLAIEEFDVNKVVEEHLKIYTELMERAK